MRNNYYHMKIKSLIKKFLIFFKKIFLHFRLKDVSNECVIFGSGPSINTLNIDSDFFNNKDFIGCNFICNHHKFKSKEFKFYSLIDIDYSKSIKDEFFNQLNCKNILIATKNAFFLKNKIIIKKNIKILKTRAFNTKKLYKYEDILKRRFFLTGNSLPFLIQIAALIGRYKKIYLFGVDHFDIKDLNNLEEMNYENYEGRNFKKLNMSKEKLQYINDLYFFINNLLLQTNSKIINITPNSKLTCFPKLIVKDLTYKDQK